jgi:hypothetical protein
MDVAWAVTKRQIERTARATVDATLGRAYVAEGGGDEEGFILPTPTAEVAARGDALVLIGGTFSGEKPHQASRPPSSTDESAPRGHTALARVQAVDKAVDAIGGVGRQLAQAGSFLGGLLAASASAPPAEAARAAGEQSAPREPASAEGAAAPPSEPPVESVGAFFRESFKMSGW